MNNLSFFSYLIAGVGFSGLGFSTLTGGEDNGLPHVGAIIEPIEEIVPVVQKVRVIPRVISPSDIEKEYDNLPCAKTLFPKVSSWEVPSDEESKKEIKNKDRLQGCLSVWWDTEDSSDGEGSTIIGNALWSMSDGEFGTVLLSKVTIKGGKVTKKANEKLVLFGEKTGEDTWKTLLNSDGNEDWDDEDEEGEGDSTDSASGWSELTETKGRQDWSFVPPSSSSGEYTGTNSWRDQVNKWLNEHGMLTETLQYYEDVDGSFEEQQEE